MPERRSRRRTATGKKLGGLIADGVIEQDDRRYLDAQDATKAALARTEASEKDYRDELAELVAAVDALRLT